MQRQVMLALWYRQGTMAAERGDWQGAVAAFKQVAVWARDYRDTAERLAHARQQVELATWYQRGLRALERGDWGSARRALERVTQVELGYRDAIALLVEALVQLSGAAEVAACYEQGVRAWQYGDWAAAQVALQRVTQLAPGYRDAAILLAEAQARLAEAQQPHISARGAKEKGRTRR